MKTLSLILILISLAVYAKAQSLLDEINAAQEPMQELAEATFKGSRIINGHSVITRKKSDFEFLIAHRFGRLNSGPYEFFGIDNANVRFGFEYGLSDRITLGIGRNSFEKTYDSFYKIALIRQQTGKKNIPLSITLFSSVAWKSLKDPETGKLPTFTRTLSYVHQLLIARKMSKRFSWQLTPSIVHFNYVEEPQENILPAVGFGGRFKITDRVSINAEYFYRIATTEPEGTFDPVALGIDIETGGHVFQLQLSNSRSMIEKGFIRETTGDPLNGDIHFGFNVTRVF